MSTEPQSWLLDKTCQDDDLESCDSQIESQDVSQEEIQTLAEKFVALQSQQFFLHYFIEKRKKDQQWPSNEDAVKNIRCQRMLLREETETTQESYQKLTKIIDDITNDDDKTVDSKLIIEAQSLNQQLEEYENINDSYNASLKRKNIRAVDFQEIFNRQTVLFHEQQKFVDNASQIKIDSLAEIERMKKECGDMKELTKRLQWCTQLQPLTVKDPPLKDLIPRQICDNIKIEWISKKNLLKILFVSPKSCSSTPSMTAILRLSHNEDDIWSIRGCQLNNAPVHLHNWASQAIHGSTEIPHFILTLHEKWSADFPLLEEIEQLRNLYGIDWIPDSRELTMMLMDGEAALVLRIDQHYPQIGSLQIKQIRGKVAQNLDTNTLTPSGITMLSDFLQYIQNKLKS